MLRKILLIVFAGFWVAAVFSHNGLAQVPEVEVTPEDSPKTDEEESKTAKKQEKKKGKDFSLPFS